MLCEIPVTLSLMDIVSFSREFVILFLAMLLDIIKSYNLYILTIFEYFCKVHQDAVTVSQVLLKKKQIENAAKNLPQVS